MKEKKTIEFPYYNFEFLLIMSNNDDYINESLYKYGIKLFKEVRYSITETVHGCVLKNEEDTIFAMVLVAGSFDISILVHECYHMAEKIIKCRLQKNRITIGNGQDQQDSELTAYILQDIFKKVNKFYKTNLRKIKRIK